MFHAGVDETSLDDNDGNSYGVFTLLSIGLGPMFILLEQQVTQTWTRVFFTLFAAAMMLLATFNLLSLFWRVNVRQEFEVTPKFVGNFRVPVLSRVNWRYWRLLDAYLAWNLAQGYIYLVFYVWDLNNPLKNSQFNFCADLYACHNIWAVWVECTAAAFDVFATSVDIPSPGVWAKLVHTFYTGIDVPITIAVIISVIDQSHVLRERMKELRMRLSSGGGAAAEEPPQQLTGAPLYMDERTYEMLPFGWSDATDDTSSTSSGTRGARLLMRPLAGPLAPRHATDPAVPY